MELSVLPQFSEYSLSLKQTEKGILVKDCLRKKWVVFTPEEYVRQQIIMHLCALGVPNHRFLVEKRVENLQKRFDCVVLNSQLSYSMLIECKAEHVPITEAVITQIRAYNVQLRCSYILISNGGTHLLGTSIPVSSWEELCALLIA